MLPTVLVCTIPHPLFADLLSSRARHQLVREMFVISSPRSRSGALDRHRRCSFAVGCLRIVGINRAVAPHRVHHHGEFARARPRGSLCHLDFARCSPQLLMESSPLNRVSSPVPVLGFVQSFRFSSCRHGPELVEYLHSRGGGDASPTTAKMIHRALPIVFENRNARTECVRLIDSER